MTPDNYRRGINVDKSKVLALARTVYDTDFAPAAEARLLQFAALIEAEMGKDAEPVAWSVFDKRTKKHWYTNESKYTAQHYAKECAHQEPDNTPSMVVVPLYTHPAPAVDAEPVAYIGTDGSLGWLKKPSAVYSKPIPLYMMRTTAREQEA